MATEERWVCVEDVAAHLGVAKDSVYRWIDERGLPAHRVGRLLRFKLSEVDEWVHHGSQGDAKRPKVRKRNESKVERKQLNQKIRINKTKKAKNE